MAEGYSASSSNDVQTSLTKTNNFTNSFGGISFGNYNEVPPSIFGSPQNLMIFGLLAIGVLYFALRK